MLQAIPFSRFRKSVLITTCADTPIRALMDFLFGTPPAGYDWELIFKEYQRLTSDAQGKEVLMLLKRITVEINKINIAKTIINTLANGRHTGLEKQLIALGYRNPLMALNLIKTQEMQIAGMQNELEQMQKTGKSATRQDFEEQIERLGKYQGYDVGNVSIARYCAIVRNYKEEIKSQEKWQQAK